MIKIDIKEYNSLKHSFFTLLRMMNMCQNCITIMKHTGADPVQIQEAQAQWDAMNTATDVLGERIELARKLVKNLSAN